MNARVEPKILNPPRYVVEVVFLDEVWQAIDAYAKAHKIKPEVAIAESCRAYFVGDSK